MLGLSDHSAWHARHGVQFSRGSGSHAWLFRELRPEAEPYGGGTAGYNSEFGDS